MMQYFNIKLYSAERIWMLQLHSVQCHFKKWQMTSDFSLFQVKESILSCPLLDRNLQLNKAGKWKLGMVVEYI